MKLAVPYEDGQVAKRFGHCGVVRIYEDDHGRVQRITEVPVCGDGHGAVVAAIAPLGVDAVLCGNIGAAGQAALQEEGVLVHSGIFGSADEAVLRFLNGSIVFDPNNRCHACGHGSCASTDCGSCGSTAPQRAESRPDGKAPSSHGSD